MGSRDVKRRWLLWVALLALLLIVVTRFTSLAQLGRTLATARWQWVLVAVLAHLVYFLCYAWLFKLAFAAVDIDSRWSEVTPVFLASLFVNAVAPSGGASGGVLWVDEANRRNRSGARTAVGLLLQLMVDMATLIPFLAYGLIFLSAQRDLQLYDIIGPAVYAAGIVFFAVILFLAWWRPHGLRRLLDWFEQTANHWSQRLRHRELLKPDWAPHTASDLRAAVRAVVRHRRILIATLTLNFMLHSINATGLYFLFLAFGQHVQLGTLIAGFGMGIVFYVVTIVPQGLAAVEGVMALVFTSLGLPNPTAVAVVLVFRTLNYWLPLVVGAFFVHRLRVFGGGESRPANADSRESG
jgi:uncharacterized protein (TIRG00374 family)